MSDQQQPGLQPPKSSIASRGMMTEPNQSRLYNNADSFAAAFDEAWRSHSEHELNHGLANHEKLLLILNELADHPFVQTDSAMAHKIGEFRIRLLGF